MCTTTAFQRKISKNTAELQFSQESIKFIKFKTHAYIHYEQIIFCELKFRAAANGRFDSSHIMHSVTENTPINHHATSFMCNKNHNQT